MKGIIKKSYDFLSDHLGKFFVISIILSIFNRVEYRLTFENIKDTFKFIPSVPFVVGIFFAVIELILSTFSFYVNVEIYKAIREDRSPKILSIFKSIINFGYEFFFLCILIKIKTFLWMLLLIVPGIIKSLSYQRAIYLKADDPTLSISECFEMAQFQMDGRKMDLFSKIFLIQLFPAILTVLGSVTYVFRVIVGGDFNPISIIILVTIFVVVVILGILCAMLRIIIEPMFNITLNEELNEEI